MFTKRHVLKGNWKGVLGGIQIQGNILFLRVWLFMDVFNLCKYIYDLCTSI